MSTPGGPASGLRDPQGAARRVGQVTLVLEAMVLLLALRPIEVLGDGAGPLALAAVGVLALACLALSGLLGRQWAWPAGTGLQVAVLVTGLLSWPVAGVGAVFLATWLYVLRLRAAVSEPARFDH